MAETIPIVIGPQARHHRLSNSELDELAEFLESAAVPEGCMNLEQADGFLCALAVGPLPTAPEEWLTILWGEDPGPAFESPEQKKRIVGLLMRHWRWVSESVTKPITVENEFYMPLIFDPDDDTPDGAMYTRVGQNWAEGFAIGVNIDEELWDTCIADEETLPCFAPIILLNLGENPDQPDMVIDYGKRKELVVLLPLSVHELYVYWRTHPPEAAESAPSYTVESPYRAQPKPGRNDPCPCGSGKIQKVLRRRRALN
jgi:uncharacterized protein